MTDPRLQLRLSMPSVSPLSTHLQLEHFAEIVGSVTRSKDQADRLKEVARTGEGGVDDIETLGALAAPGAILTHYKMPNRGDLSTLNKPGGYATTKDVGSALRISAAESTKAEDLLTAF